MGETVSHSIITGGTENKEKGWGVFSVDFALSWSQTQAYSFLAQMRTGV